ncbi:hypothetical protein KP509_03G015300 [Ceratopteris richardii]|uniref:AAA+ ATPase domain-containing protein n=2 Tax=Ceratopteris richardii TaxID=49495 RepID=A0A8T2V4Z4_CERRI|nr:hypothetical protein KP509_03G015300 [Ceratopteris richardii]
MAKLAASSTMAAALAAGSCMLFKASASADGGTSSFYFPFLSGRSPPAVPPSQSPDSSSPAEDATKASSSEFESSKSGFDPEALERGARVLREINNSKYSKKVFELMRKQEDTRLAEEATRRARNAAHQVQVEVKRQEEIFEDQRKIIEQEAQTEAQMARYEDELARKRMQTEHEAQRGRNRELVRMQEEAAARQEQLRRQTEEQIQAQQRKAERQRAEIERETIRVRAMAEAEGRAHEAKLAEGVNRRLLIDRANLEKDKWLAAINTAFSHIEGGLRDLVTDREKLIIAVGAVTALAGGVYMTREGSKVMWGYIERILGQPSLIRESSRGKYPWSRWVSEGGIVSLFKKSAAAQEMKEGAGFGNVILHPALHKRIQHLAMATANTKLHEAPFRNMLFYGPPGTGKTMAAKELAKKSGLEYALMTGGDVAPLGSQAVTKIHELFNWAARSKKGLLLFIDEADAFLCKRSNKSTSEGQRSALNALLYRTGDQSRDVVLVLATNRPGDLDAAITDRIDEVIEFPLPREEERVKLLKLYLDKYIVQAGTKKKDGKLKIWHEPDRIEIIDITDDVLKEAAKKMEGFSGREIAKTMASVQGAVYGSKRAQLDADLFREVINYKVAEHQQRKIIAKKGDIVKSSG